MAAHALTLAAAVAGAVTPAPSPHGLDLAGIDRSVAPGDDFFRYANGAWLKATEIPPDRSSYGPAEQLAELTAERTAELVRNTAAAAAGSEARKIGDYYASFMDEDGIEKKSLEPLQPALRRIEAIKDRAGLAQALGATLRADVDVLNNTTLQTPNLLGLWVAQDLDDPARYVPFLLQGGLGMPDRDYYLNPSQKMADIRAKYQAHIAGMLALAQLPDAQGKAARIFDLERRMAQVHWSRAQSEQVLKGNNHWARKDFGVRAPGLDWEAFLGAAGLARQQEFVVWQPSAVTGLSALAAGQPLETWKDYLRFHAIEGNAAYLPKAFVEEHFAFHGRVLSGTPQLRPRWKRAMADTNNALGEAVGKLYVQRYFPPAEKARAEAMVRNLLAAFAVRIDRLGWMAPETRAKAKAKLATLKVGVGYPVTWRDYSGLQVIRGDAFGNAQRAELFEYQRNLAKLGAAVDRSEWVMNPQLVNAVNLPAMNALNFPAAILQPPFFDPKADMAVNYGGIGAVIGHEITHGFDDQGRKSDGSGMLRDWWAAEDAAKFEVQATKYGAQYEAVNFPQLPGLHIIPKLTMGENIGDLGGILMALDAYHISLKGQPAAVLDGFTGDQRVFLGWAQVWCESSRPEAERLKAATNPHASNKYRVNGPLSNMPEFQKAFSCKANAPMMRANACRVW